MQVWPRASGWSASCSAAEVPPWCWEERNDHLTNQLMCNMFPVFHRINKINLKTHTKTVIFGGFQWGFLKTSCPNKREYTQQTSIWDPVAGSRPNNIGLSPIRRTGSSISVEKKKKKKPSFICTGACNKRRKEKRLIWGRQSPRSFPHQRSAVRVQALSFKYSCED